MTLTTAARRCSTSRRRWRCSPAGCAAPWPSAPPLSTRRWAPSSYGVLEHLHRSGECRQTELIRALGSEKGAISRAVQQLVDLGFAVSVPDPDDGRAHQIAISAEGARRLEDVVAARRASYFERLSDWTPDEIAGFVAELARYNAALNDSAARPGSRWRCPGRARRRTAAQQHPALGHVDRRQPAVEATDDVAATERQHVRPGVQHLHEVARRRRERTPNGQGGAVERQRRVRVGVLRLHGQRPPVAGLRDPRTVPLRAEAVGRLVAAPRDRHPAAVAAGARRCAGRGRVLPALGRYVDLLEAELLALVEVRRTGQRQHDQRRGPGPAPGRPRRRRTGWGAGRRRGWTAPRSAVRRPTSTAAACSVMTSRNAVGRPRRGQPVEVERLVQLVGPHVAGERLRVAGPGLADRHPVAGVRVEDPAPGR